MRAAKIVVPLGVLCAAAWGQSTVQTKVFAVEGVVTNSVTGAPVRKATVSAHGGGTVHITASDQSGRFRFEGLLASERFDLEAQGPEVERARGPSVRSEHGEDVNDIRIQLVPYGVISGRVVDENKDPVAGVQVAAVWVSFAGYQRSIDLSSEVTTDDRGSTGFRISGRGNITWWRSRANPTSGMARFDSITMVPRLFIHPPIFLRRRRSAAG